MKKTYLLLGILILVALVSRLLFAFSGTDLWWDSAVYVGMGKYLMSSGESGLWEHIRPPLMPVFLGFFWMLGISPIIAGFVIELLFMVGVVLLTYWCCLQFFDSRSAFIAGLFVALSPILFLLSFQQYTEIPGMFFVLAGVAFCIKKRYFWSGVALGLAFLSKFPLGLFFAILFCYVALKEKLKAVHVGIGFSLIVIPYLLFSWVFYGDLFATLSAANKAISLAVGCNILRFNPWWQYFSWIVFAESILHFFSLVGLFVIAKKWNKKYLLLLGLVFVPLIYLMQLNCRDYRYLTMFLPFVAMLSGFGITSVLEKVCKKNWCFWIAAIFVIILTGFSSFSYYNEHSVNSNPVEQEYFNYLNDKSFSKEVWVANPSFALFTDAKLEKVYYPIYDGGVATDFVNYLRKNKESVSAVLLDNCGGGIICAPSDTKCEAITKDLLSHLDSQFIKDFDKSYGRCWYRVWVNN